MRIVKLSPEDEAMKTPAMLRTYFEKSLPEGTLRSKSRHGKFLITPNRIAKDHFDFHEMLIFTYKGKIKYFAYSASEIKDNKDSDKVDYPTYFIVNLKSIRRCNGMRLKQFEKRLKENGINKNLISHGWVIIPESVENKKIIERLIGELIEDKMDSKSSLE